MMINNEEEIYLDLNNPIFALYINGSRYYIDSVSKFFSVYKNITVWVIPSTGESKMECIFKGIKSENSIESFESIFNIFKSSETFEDFKSNLREFHLSNIV